MRIVIADDHFAVRKGVRAILAESFPTVTCEEAEIGEQAVQLVLANRPDLVILDINMPVLDGFGAAIQIHEHAADIPILFFTMHYGESFLSQARRIGVQGYVSKDRAGEMLVEAVNALLQNKTYFPNTRASLGVETGPHSEKKLV